MNLLLLLSALLSALTGVSSRAGGIAPAVAMAERVVAPVAAERRTTKPERPVAAVPTPAMLARIRVALGVPPQPLAPLFFSRRRE